MIGLLIVNGLRQGCDKTFASKIQFQKQLQSIVLPAATQTCAFESRTGNCFRMLGEGITERLEGWSFGYALKSWTVHDQEPHAGA